MGQRGQQHRARQALGFAYGISWQICSGTPLRTDVALPASSLTTAKNWHGPRASRNHLAAEQLASMPNAGNLFECIRQRVGVKIYDSFIGKLC